MDRQLGMDMLEHCRLEGGCEEIDVKLIHKVIQDIKHREPAS